MVCFNISASGGQILFGLSVVLFLIGLIVYLVGRYALTWPEQESQSTACVQSGVIIMFVSALTLLGAICYVR